MSKHSELAEEISKALSVAARQKKWKQLTYEEKCILIDQKLSEVRKALGKNAMTESEYIKVCQSIKTK